MISVAIQGGAMRSIYCFGAIRAVIDCGLFQQVGAIHTASAGCVSGAILATYIANPDARSVTDTRDLFLNRLNGRQFINPFRLHRVVDVDLLVDAIRTITPLTPQSLSAQKLAFEVGVTDAKTGAPKYIDLTRLGSADELHQAFRATMAIPALFPKRVMIDGRRYIDGGISDPLPALRALRSNPSTLITISCVAESHLGLELEGRELDVMRFVPFVLSRNVKHLLMVRNPLAAATEELSKLGTFNDVRIIRIAPTDQKLVGHRLDTDRTRLGHLEELGYRDACRALAGTTVLPSPQAEAARPADVN